MIKIYTKFSVLLCIALLICISDASAQNLADTLKKPNMHLILRHALAPGTGDPANFQIDDCTTQRNLNDEGHEQASKIGDYLKKKNIHFDRVLSSEWCRCLDTARSIGIKDVEPFQSLNSIWTQTEDVKIKRTRDLKKFLTNRPDNETNLLITHYANILALTGETTASGEGLVIQIKNNKVEILERFKIQ